jgi:hypothetical protein
MVRRLNENPAITSQAVKQERTEVATRSSRIRRRSLSA